MRKKQSPCWLLGHSSGKQVFLERLLDRSAGCDGMVQLQKFRKGEGIDDKFYISSAYISGEFPGQQPGIGACDINIAVQSDAQGIDALFPALDLLDFVKEEVNLSGDSGSTFQEKPELKTMLRDFVIDGK